VGIEKWALKKRAAWAKRKEKENPTYVKVKRDEEFHAKCLERY